MTEANLIVKSKRKLAQGLFTLEFTDENLPDIRCGQFINLEIPNRPDLVLRRPFAVLDFNKSEKSFKIGINIVGSGTLELARAKKGDILKATYPLGNGFVLGEKHQKILLLGGGTGLFPLFCVGKSYPDLKLYSFLGYKDRDRYFLAEEFKSFSKETFITTEDGSFGEKGFITDILSHNLDRIMPDIILACGPINMLRSLKKMIGDKKMDVKISLEERMGCGVGACLVCACMINHNGGILNRRVCKDGPVFDLGEVIL